jgi:hypothetical protein
MAVVTAGISVDLITYIGSLVVVVVPVSKSKLFSCRFRIRRAAVVPGIALIASYLQQSSVRNNATHGPRLANTQ